MLGKKSSEKLRGRLQLAMTQKNKVELEKMINECVAAGMSELDDDIHQARTTLDVWKGGTGGQFLHVIFF